LGHGTDDVFFGFDGAEFLYSTRTATFRTMR